MNSKSCERFATPRRVPRKSPLGRSTKADEAAAKKAEHRQNFGGDRAQVLRLARDRADELGGVLAEKDGVEVELRLERG